MSKEDDIEIIAKQESQLVFPTFDEATAFAIGSAIRERALTEGLAIVVDIRTWDRPLFYAALPGSTGVQPRLGAAQDQRGEDVPEEHLPHGAGARRDPTAAFRPRTAWSPPTTCWPAAVSRSRVKGAGVIGVIAVSGLP